MKPRALLIPLLACTLGCGSTGVGNPGIGGKDQQLVTRGHDALSAGDTGSSLNLIPVLALRGDPAVEDTAAVVNLVVERTAMFFEPTGCLSATADGASVTFTFDGCTSTDFTDDRLTGTLEATYELVPPRSVDIALATEPTLSVGASEVTFTSQSLATLRGEEKTLNWAGRYQSSRPDEPDLDTQGSYVATRDEASGCLLLEGTATTTFADGSQLESTVSEYQRCGPRGMCPVQGELALTSLPDRDRSLALAYDGDESAFVDALQSDATVQCTP